MKEEIHLTMSQLISVVQKLPNPSAPELRIKLIDVVVWVEGKGCGSELVYQETPTPRQPVDMHLITLRFRLNRLDTFIPQWEPLQRIIIDNEQ